MFVMPESSANNEDADDARRSQLQSRLREVDVDFRSKMRARGFNPDQDDNLALTAPLAKLYTEREKLREELAALTKSNTH